MSRLSRASLVLLAAGVVGFLYLNSATAADPKPVEITEEWMEENVQEAYKDLLKGSRSAAAAFAKDAATYEKAATKLGELSKVVGVSKPPKELKPIAVWKKHAEELGKASEAAAAAAKAKNAVAYKAAFRRLDDACNKCHTDYKP